MNKVFGFIATAAAALAIYILMAFPLDSGEAVLGLLISLLSAILMVSFLPFDLRLLNPVRVIKALIYLPFFFRKMIQANISIAAIVLQPKLPIKPAIIKEETNLSSAEGRLILTSSITLTPGTLSVDIDDHNLFVHCVSKTEEKLLEPFEKHIRGISE
ncbi:MAG: Na+/H+ antiporter subunit D [Spirochaeta sp.]|nr:Na+/H+ antiporter subunit D [Spirochaeta sp.]